MDEPDPNLVGVRRREGDGHLRKHADIDPLLA